MRIIRFVFSSPINVKLPLYSMAIKKFEKTKYSHVSMHFESKSLDRTIIYEAVGLGVRFIGKKLWDTHAEIVESFDVEVSDECYISIMQHCVDTAGMDYGIKIAVGMFLAKVFRLKKNYLADPNKKVCSKAIGELLEKAKYKFNKELDLLDPQDINESLVRGLDE